MNKLVLLIACLAVACGGDDYNPNIDPAHFVSGVTNPLFPLVPGTVFDYKVQETTETVKVTVLSETKVIKGVTCVVVHDVATSGGQVAEDTFDWYAQDDKGNVWYMGEDTTEFDAGMTSKEGSWEYGVDGALPGIVMEGSPKVGDVYRQEYLKDEAEDQGEVLSLDASVTVQYGMFTGCVQTRDFTDLDTAHEENKYFCPNVGQVRAIATKGGAETEDLIAVTKP